LRLLTRARSQRRRSRPFSEYDGHSRGSDEQPNSKEPISKDAHKGLCFRHPIRPPRAVYWCNFTPSCSNGGNLMARAHTLAWCSALPWST